VRRRRGERGAETLELVAGLPLLGVVVAAAVQCAVLVEEHARAASDARELVRHQVVCEHRDEPPAAVAGDALLTAGRVSFTTAGDPAEGVLVTATVVLPPRTILPGLPAGVSSPLAARASATMRQEPC
jgi:hypothetical protein